MESCCLALPLYLLYLLVIAILRAAGCNVKP